MVGRIQTVLAELVMCGEKSSGDSQVLSMEQIKR